MFKSIRSKLTLSYLLVILLSMAVTGFFFQWRMKQVLEDSLVKELRAQANIISGTISSLASSPESIAAQAENVTDRYSDEPDRRLKVYSPSGFLIADSSEPGIGLLDPGDELLSELFPNQINESGNKITWTSSHYPDKVVYHQTWPIHLRGEDGVVELFGAVDVSVVLKPGSGKKLPEDLQEKVDKAADRVLKGIYKSSPETVGIKVLAQKLMSGTSFEKPLRIRIYNNRREIVANSQRMSVEKINKLSSTGSIDWIQEPPDGRILNVAMPIRSSLSGILLGHLILSSSMNFIDATYAQLQRVLFYAIGISLIITLAVSFILAFGLIRPITRIKQVASRIAGGDFSQNVEYGGKDEIRDLARTINDMSAQIQEKITEIEGEKDKINALLSALPDGVIALDYDGQIIFLNESAQQLLNINAEELSGKKLLDVLDEKDIEEFFVEGKQKEGVFSREIAIPPRILKFYLIRYGQHKGVPPGIMLVVRDVTDLRRLEETRTRFLSSISHELRTPITVIKGFIHTIIDEKPIVETPEAHRALRVMDGEIDRLTRLVNDLLELSRLRSKKLSMEMITLNADSLVEETFAQMVPNAKRMGLNMELNLTVKNTELQADRDRMKQVIINLIDNAIKYTPAGRKVTVSTRREDKYWILDIVDTGMGIARDELPFLFERFFRTRDKKKKKLIKGTGLGMAIVKEIVDAHNGKIKVDSKRGEGTRIHIYIPVRNPENEVYSST